MHRALLAVLSACAAACATRDSGGAPRGDSATVAGDTLASAHPVATPATSDSTGAAAPAAGAVEYYTAAQLDQVAAALSRGGTSGRTLGARGTWQFIQSRRVNDGSPEIHERWTDVTIVQAGHATLLSGGRVNGGTDQGAGERRGGAIIGGTRRPVGAGDLMVIPAGVPHQYELSRGDSLRYITVKVLAVRAGNS